MRLSSLLPFGQQEKKKKKKKFPKRPSVLRGGVLEHGKVEKEPLGSAFGHLKWTLRIDSGS